MSGAPPETARRETRMLALVVLVSIGLLIVLSRFQFPAATLTVPAPAPSPLAGLAARAAFDDMAATSRALLANVSDALVPVDLRTPPVRPPPRGAEPTPPEVDHVVGIR